MFNPAVLGALAVWIQNPKKKEEKKAGLHSNSRNTHIQHVPHPANYLVWSPLCPPYQGEQTMANLNAPFLVFFFPLQSRGKESSASVHGEWSAHKLRVYNPGDTARHSQPTKTLTDKNRQKTRFSPTFPGSASSALAQHCFFSKYPSLDQLDSPYDLWLMASVTRRVGG